MKAQYIVVHMVWVLMVSMNQWMTFLLSVHLCRYLIMHCTTFFAADVSATTNLYNSSVGDLYVANFYLEMFSFSRKPTSVTTIGCPLHGQLLPFWSWDLMNSWPFSGILLEWTIVWQLRVACCIFRFHKISAVLVLQEPPLPWFYFYRLPPGKSSLGPARYLRRIPQWRCEWQNHMST